MSTIKYRPSVKKKLAPSEYILEPGLKNAVEVALALDQPLLLTGEPGTGKTQLAYKTVFDLSQGGEANFSDQLIRFDTKTTSTAKDLFYSYDALGHFQSANIKRDAGQTAPDIGSFVTLQALGKAIALSNPKGIQHPELRKQLKLQDDKPKSSVILIDEVDKAPRDFTNDLLNQIENSEFFIQEMNEKITRGDGQRTLILLTSNSEKNLPDAFLRRCVFYHIPFPSADLLRKIVKVQVGLPTNFTDQMLNPVIDFFFEVREKSIRKRPATAEFIAWMRLLALDKIAKVDDQNLRRELMRDNLSILVKTQEDLEAVSKL
ncbi:MAG: AAA family ATPase [Phaeodactylibacter sp.]|nr:AAA family ATPase [Phaeodactylibacter sp.]